MAAPKSKSQDVVIKPKRTTQKQRAQDITQATLRSLNPQGNTVLKDFGRAIREEAHKYIYPIKLYPTRDKIREEDMMVWLRERYIQSKGHIHHGTRYEVRSYSVDKKVDGQKHQRYVDYVLLEKLSDHERTMLALEFGEFTEDKVIRDGKLRRPRLSKDQKVLFDKMVDEFYLKVERDRIENAKALLERRTEA